MKFKVGDLVERVRGDHSGMGAGDKGIVRNVSYNYDGTQSLSISMFGIGHLSTMFKLVESKGTLCPFACPHNVEGKCREKLEKTCDWYKDYKGG